MRLHEALAHTWDLGARHVPVDPVEDVQSAVGTKGEDVMRCDRLRLARALQQEHLRQYRDRLQEDTVGPEHLIHGEVDVKQERKHCRNPEEQVKTNGVNVHLVARTAWLASWGRCGRVRHVPVAELHQVEDIQAAPNEEELHRDQVQIQRVEQEEVPRDEHHRV